MYKVIVVDDEILGRMGVASIISWEAYGFELVGSYENGLEALNAIRSDDIDLVFTDIKMPVMDGIELIRNIKALDISCTIVVLSSYSDFVYVKDALKLGAIDYVLKMELKEETIAHILEEVNEKPPKAYSRTELGSDRQEADLKREKRECIKMLMYGHITTKGTLTDQMEALNIHIERFTGYVLTFGVSDLRGRVDGGQVMEMIEEVTLDYENSYVTWTSHNEISILFSTHVVSEQSNHELVSQLGQRTMFIMSEFFNQRPIIYISSLTRTPEYIPLAYLQTYQAQKISDVISEGRLIFYDEAMKHKQAVDYKQYEDCIKHYQEAVGSKDLPKVTQSIDEISHAIKGTSHLDLSNVHFFVSTLVTLTNIYIEVSGIDKIDFWGGSEPQYNILKDISKKTELLEFLEDLKTRISSNVIENENNYLINEAKIYIKQNCHTYISFKDLASDLGVSSSYLSGLFSRVTGTTMKSYLIGIRLEKACHLLLNGYDTISDIGRMVGYENTAHFCRIFKKHYLVTPSDYRNRKEVSHV